MPNEDNKGVNFKKLTDNVLKLIDKVLDVAAVDQVRDDSLKEMIRDVKTLKLSKVPDSLEKTEKAIYGKINIAFGALEQNTAAHAIWSLKQASYIIDLIVIARDIENTKLVDTNYSAELCEDLTSTLEKVLLPEKIITSFNKDVIPGFINLIVKLSNIKSSKAQDTKIINNLNTIEDTLNKKLADTVEAIINGDLTVSNNTNNPNLNIQNIYILIKALKNNLGSLKTYKETVKADCKDNLIKVLEKVDQAQDIFKVADQCSAYMQLMEIYEIKSQNKNLPLPIAKIIRNFIQDNKFLENPSKFVDFLKGVKSISIGGKLDKENAGAWLNKRKFKKEFIDIINKISQEILNLVALNKIGPENLIPLKIYNETLTLNTVVDDKAFKELTDNAKQYREILLTSDSKDKEIIKEIINTILISELNKNNLGAEIDKKLANCSMEKLFAIYNIDPNKFEVEKKEILTPFIKIKDFIKLQDIAYLTHTAYYKVLKEIILTTNPTLMETIDLKNKFGEAWVEFDCTEEKYVELFNAINKINIQDFKENLQIIFELDPLDNLTSEDASNLFINAILASTMDQELSSKAGNILEIFLNKLYSEIENPDTLKSIINMQLPQFQNKSLLCEAVKLSNLKAVKLLIAKKANVNIETDVEEYPTLSSYALKKLSEYYYSKKNIKQNIQIFKVLLEAGIILNKDDIFNLTKIAESDEGLFKDLIDHLKANFETNSKYDSKDYKDEKYFKKLTKLLADNTSHVENNPESTTSTPEASSISTSVELTPEQEHTSEANNKNNEELLKAIPKKVTDHIVKLFQGLSNSTSSDSNTKDLFKIGKYIVHKILRYNENFIDLIYCNNREDEANILLNGLRSVSDQKKKEYNITANDKIISGVIKDVTGIGPDTSTIHYEFVRLDVLPFRTDEWTSKGCVQIIGDVS